MIPIIIAIVIVICIFIWIYLYNKFVRMSTNIDNSWSQIDVQLKRRNDLIPNLVSTVKGYAGYEKSTLEKVTQMRGQIVHISDDDPNETNRQKIMQISNQLAQTMKSIFAVSERYPDLKANADFKDLMDELTNTENKIAYARQLYNNVVAQYNAAIKSFPGNLVAGSKFTKHQFLKTPSTERETPHVNFNDLNK